MSRLSLLSFAGARRRFRGGSGNTPSAAQSTFTLDKYAITANNTDTATGAGTIKNSAGSALANVAVTTTATACTVDGTASNVTGPVTVAQNTDCTLTITLIDNETGDPIPDIAAADISLAVSGTGNTLTPLSGSTNADGIISTTFQSSVAETKNVTCSILPSGANVSITGTSFTVSGSAVDYPNQPAGLSAIVEMDPSVLGFSRGTPGDGTFTGLLSGASVCGRAPIDLLTVTGSPAYLNYVWETGTPPGYNAASGDNVGFNLGGTAFNGVTGPSYTTWYQSTTFNLYGNAGTDFQTVLGPGVKTLGYWGVTNQDGVHGPYQIYMVGIPVDPDSSVPALATEFSIRLYFQNGASYGPLDPNVVTDKYIVVGTEHQFEILMTTGTNGGNDGTIDIWLDNVHIHHWTNAPFLNSSYASGGGDGITPFWGWGASLVWGGSAGGPGDWTKTRDDAIRFFYTYISGA